MKKIYKTLAQIILIITIAMPIYNCSNSFADMISIPIDDYKKLNPKQIQEKVEKRRLEIEQQQVEREKQEKLAKQKSKQNLSKEEKLNEEDE